MLPQSPQTPFASKIYVFGLNWAMVPLLSPLQFIKLPGGASQKILEPLSGFVECFERGSSGRFLDGPVTCDLLTQRPRSRTPCVSARALHRRASVLQAPRRVWITDKAQRLREVGSAEARSCRKEVVEPHLQPRSLGSKARLLQPRALLPPCDFPLQPDTWLALRLGPRVVAPACHL